jgi:hypothetical protein
VVHPLAHSQLTSWGLGQGVEIGLGRSWVPRWTLRERQLIFTGTSMTHLGQTLPLAHGYWMCSPPMSLYGGPCPLQMRMRLHLGLSWMGRGRLPARTRRS